MSRAFRSRCLHYMFRDVYLAGPHHAKTLSDLCLNSPRLCSCVDSLTLVRSDPNLCWDMHTDKHLLPLIKLLTKVTIIHISGLEWGWFPDDVLDALASFPLLAGLSLHDISFSDGVQSFYSFVGQLGNLVVIRIQGKMTISESEEEPPVVFPRNEASDYPKPPHLLFSAIPTLHRGHVHLSCFTLHPSQPTDSHPRR